MQAQTLPHSRLTTAHARHDDAAASCAICGTGGVGFRRTDRELLLSGGHDLGTMWTRGRLLCRYERQLCAQRLQLAAEADARSQAADADRRHERERHAAEVSRLQKVHRGTLRHG